MKENSDMEIEEIVHEVQTQGTPIQLGPTAKVASGVITEQKCVMEMTEQELQDTMRAGMHATLSATKSQMEETKAEMQNSVTNIVNQQLITIQEFIRNAMRDGSAHSSKAEPEEKKVTPKKAEYLWPKLEGESHIKAANRRLEEAGNDPEKFRQVVHQIKIETIEKISSLNFAPQRLTLEEKPTRSFRPCSFFQAGNCRADVYNMIHLDKNFRTNKKGYVHGCVLCYRLSKAIVEHPLKQCEVLIELDRLEEDPTYRPSLLSLFVELQANDQGAENQEGKK